MLLALALLCGCGDKGSGDSAANDGGSADGGGSVDGGGSDSGSDGGGGADGGGGGGALAEPTRVGSVSGIKAHDVALLGTTGLVAADAAGLVVLDLSDPAHPVELARVPIGTAYGVALDGTVAWVATWSGDLVAVDLATPSAPSQRGSLRLAPHAVGVDARDGLVGVASWSGTTDPGDDGWGLTLCDVTAPDDPDQLGAVSTPGTALALALDDGRAWVADGERGITPVDLAVPSAMVAGASLDVGAKAWDVASLGDAVVVAADHAGLVLLSAADGAPLSSLDTLDGDAMGLALDGSLAWVATGGAGLAGVDLSDPLHPDLAWQLSLGGTATRVALGADLGLVALGDGGVAVLAR